MVTVLKDKELFKYLNNLKITMKGNGGRTDKEYLNLDPHKKSLDSLIYSQMIEIITAESTLLKYLHPNKRTTAQLSIAPNGLPSLASLNPDLEKMCDMSKEKKVFCEIAKKFKRGKNYKQIDERKGIYVSVDEYDWKKELEVRSGQKLLSNIGFSIDNTCDGKFELTLREEIYVQDYDKYSKKLPVMVREGKIKCHRIWGSFIEDFEENFYIPNEEFELGGEIIDPSKKSFSGIKASYKFGRFDYPGVGKPLFLKWSGESIDYSKFLAAGTNTRVKTTQGILELINNTLKKDVIIKGVKKENLAKVLSFSQIPFENAPKTTPTQNQLSSIEKYNNTCFDLIYNSGGERIGEIEFQLPYKYKDHSDDDFKFSLGGVELEVYGSAILNENQDEYLKKGLSNVKKCKLEDLESQEDFD